jgi:hypothetical protein
MSALSRAGLAKSMVGSSLRLDTLVPPRAACCAPTGKSRNGNTLLPPSCCAAAGTAVSNPRERQKPAARRAKSCFICTKIRPTGRLPAFNAAPAGFSAPPFGRKRWRATLNTQKVLRNTEKVLPLSVSCLPLTVSPLPLSVSCLPRSVSPLPPGIAGRPRLVGQRPLRSGPGPPGISPRPRPVRPGYCTSTLGPLAGRGSSRTGSFWGWGTSSSSRATRSTSSTRSA